MDKKSKTLLAIFFIGVLVSLVLGYYKYVINRDYIIFDSEENMPEQTDIKAILEL